MDAATTRAASALTKGSGVETLRTDTPLDGQSKDMIGSQASISERDWYRQKPQNLEMSFRVQTVDWLRQLVATVC